MLSRILFVLVLLFSSNSTVYGEPKISSFRKLYLSKKSLGPESITFEAGGGGPYTSDFNGKIVRYDSQTNTFQDFSYTRRNRPEKCDEEGREGWFLGAECGRPVGMEFYGSKNELFIADAFEGLLVVGLNGGLARNLATSADDGQKFVFPNGLTVDQSTGDVYFTDFSTVYPLSKIKDAITSQDKTGRLLKYSYSTRNVNVLMKELSGANGVAISSDGSFLLVTETLGQRVQKYWLKGDKASKSQVVAELQGRPDNIKRTPSEDHFWVALNFNDPNKLPTVPARAMKLDGYGNILEDFNFSKYYNTTQISEFYQRGDQFFVGSMLTDYVGVFN